MTTTEQYTGWLSSAGIIRNGGLKAPGQEHLAAVTGTHKAKLGQVKKDTSFTSAIPAPVQARQVTEKTITRDRPLGPGYFQFGETVAKVQISKSSGRPYAKVLDLVSGSFEYAPGVMTRLFESDRLTIEVAAKMGRQTGRCMICARELTNTDSIERGIGPICAGKL